MSDLDELPVTPPPAATPPRRRRLRKRWIVLASVLVLLIGAGVVLWEATRPPRAVSVNEVVNRFRTAQPTARPSHLPAAPAAGVYVYATQGSERISAGISHRYPARTTVTISVAGCGLLVRWDALSGRRAQAQLCAVGDRWQLTHYTDVHKFLYREDVHDYTCTAPETTGDGWSTVCRTADGELTSTAHRIGSERRTIGGGSRMTTHVRIDQRATGKSLSTGRVDVWVLPDGLPVHLDITDHGSQEVLGSRITYDEKASFDLTSLTPRR